MNTKFPTKFNRPSAATIATAVALLSTLMLVTAPVMAGRADPGTPEANYQKERADCLAGRTGQDQKTCLREAGAALAEARRGRLQSTDTRVLAENALLRCQRVAEEDREDCRRMVRGEGVREGTVADGAILKKIDRMVVENPPAAGPRPPASAPRASEPPRR